MKKQILLCYLILSCMLNFSNTSKCSAQKLISSKDYLTMGQQAEIILVDCNSDTLKKVKLVAEYRPNSQTNFTRILTPGDKPGHWIIIPETAGLVNLKAMTDPSNNDSLISSKSMSIRFDRVPISGVFVIFFAGFILFGGIAISVRHALKAKDRD